MFRGLHEENLRSLKRKCTFVQEREGYLDLSKKEMVGEEAVCGRHRQVNGEMMCWLGTLAHTIEGGVRGGKTAK